jgi:hypothetical protein
MAEVPRHDEPVDGGRALIRSVYNSDVRDLTAEGLDILLDSALQEGPLRDIPVVGWLVKTYGAINTVRDWIFLRKIVRFLREAQATTAEERDAFAEQMETDPDYAREVGEGLFLLLDRHETVVVYPRIVYTDLISLMCKTPLMVGVPGVAAQRITSSAWNSSVGGIVRPRSFAVLRLMTSSNVVGCSTGRSAGLAPLRILST